MLLASDLVTYMGITTPVDAQLQYVIDTAVAATNELIVARCVPLPPTWPAPVQSAALIQGSRLIKRRASPEGVAGFGDFGPVRVSVMDPDIEAMLSPWLKLVFA